MRSGTTAATGVIAILALSTGQVPARVFPSAATTGITAGQCPDWEQDHTTSGTVTIDTDGAVLEYREINVALNVYARDVTVRCVRINAGGALYALRCDYGITCSGLVAENVEISGCGSACVLPIADEDNPVTLRRVNLHHAQGDLLKANSNLVLEHSYLHDYTPTASSHNDAMQTSSGGNIHIRHNRIEGPYREQTSAYIVKPDFGPISNIILENNFLSGGTYTLYLVGGGHGIPTNVAVVNNVWDADGFKFGPFSTDMTAAHCLEWRGNGFDDGAPIPAPTGATTVAGACRFAGAGGAAATIPAVNQLLLP